MSRGKYIMIDEFEHTGSLSWCERGDYPLLDNLCRGVSYDDAYRVFLGATGLAGDHEELVFKEGEEVDNSSIRAYTRERIGSLVPLSTDPAYQESTIYAVMDRASEWVEKYNYLLSPDMFIGTGANESTDLIDEHKRFVSNFFMDLSRSLPIFPADLDSDRNMAVHAINKGDPAVMGEASVRGIRDLYYLSMLNLLTISRFPVKESEFTRDIQIVEGWDDANGKDLTEMAYLMHTSISAFQASIKGSEKHYPVELSRVGYDYEAMKDYCRALLRLVLGRRYDLSEVLQEDLVSAEIREIANNYGFLDEFQPYLDELRDLRARIFSHVNLITSYVSSDGNSELCHPVGKFIDENVECVVDLGAGEFAWFANSLAEKNPDCEVFALDQIWEHYGRVRDNLALVPIDFDDTEAVESHMKYFKGLCSFVLASNVFHKVNDADYFLRQVVDMLEAKGGVLYIYAPAYSDKYDPVTQRAVVQQDTTAHRQNVWSFEDILDKLVTIMPGRIIIRGLSLIGPERGQNDTIPRIGIAVRVVRTKRNILDDYDGEYDGEFSEDDSLI